MPVYKDGNNGTFYVQCYYRDARGSKRHKTKRGFSSVEYRSAALRAMRAPSSAISRADVSSP